jgi:hypothetical protein
MARKKYYHKISNAYDAWWFIFEHPKLMLEERNEIAPEEAAKLEAKGFWVTRDVGGKCYRMYRHLMRHALDENLDIFYTKVNAPGGHARVDDDPKKNKYVEVWLEFGQLAYGYLYSGSAEPAGDWDTETALLHYHDTDFDCGGPTFDEALVNLAKKVRKKFGDYRPDPEQRRQNGKCGKPTCADCDDIIKTMKGTGLEKKATE